MQQTKTRLTLILIILTSLTSLAQTKLHTRGLRYQEDGNTTQGKAQLYRVGIVNEFDQLIYYGNRSDMAPKDTNHYSSTQPKTMPGVLSEGRTYTVVIELINPDSTQTPAVCGVWIDYNRDSIFDASKEPISPLGYSISTRYQNTFRFTVPNSISAGKSVMRVRTALANETINKSDANKVLKYGQTADIELVLTSRKNRDAGFVVRDTLFNKASVEFISTNPYKSVKHKWYINGKLHHNYGTDSFGNLRTSFDTAGVWTVKLVNEFKDGVKDSITKNVLVREPNRLGEPFFFVRNQKIDLYYSFECIDLNSSQNRYALWSLRSSDWPIDSIWRARDSIHYKGAVGRSAGVYAAKGIPGFPDEGAWDVCLEIKHAASAQGNSKCKRKIVLIGPDSIAPHVIALDGDTVYVGVDLLDSYESKGAVAFDNCDRNLTDSIRNTTNYVKRRVGIFFDKYWVTDSSGNTSDTADVIIIAEDKIPPNLTGRNGDTIKINLQTAFDFKSHIKITDNYNDSAYLYAVVKLVSGAVDTSKSGWNTIRIVAVDESGNQSDTLDLFVRVLPNSGVEILTHKPMFKLYPNPVNRYVNLESEQPFSSIKLFDKGGQLVRSVEVSSVTRLKIDFDRISPGNYTLGVLLDDGTNLNRKIFIH